MTQYFVFLNKESRLIKIWVIGQKEVGREEEGEGFETVDGKMSDGGTIVEKIKCTYSFLYVIRERHGPNKVKWITRGLSKHNDVYCFKVRKEY